MAGAEEVVAAVGDVRAELSGLVLNEHGWERLAATSLDRVNVTLAATESFNQRNGNASLEEATARVERILAVADRPSTATISVAFGCPFEGEVDPGVVATSRSGSSPPGPARSFLRTRSALRRRGRCNGWSSGSRSSGFRSAGISTTRATPVSQTRGPRSRPVRRCSTLQSAASAAARSPHAPRERRHGRVLYLLDREHVETGVDLEGLIAVAKWLEELLGRELPGRVYRAGTVRRYVNDAGLGQRGDLLVRVAGLAQDLGGVLAEKRRRVPVQHTLAVQRQRQRRKSEIRDLRVGEVLHDPERLRLR